MKNEKFKKIGVFNPLITDFTVKYDIKGDKNPQGFTVPAREIVYFIEPVAKHVKKHLADAIFHKRGVKNNPEMDLKEIIEEISV